MSQYVRGAAFFGDVFKWDSGFPADNFHYARCAKAAVASPHSGTAPTFYRINADCLHSERTAAPYGIPDFSFGNLLAAADNFAVERIAFN